MNELVLTKKEIPELLNKALQALKVSLIILPLPTSYTAHSCLFQPHGRTAGGKREQQVCPPLGHLCGYSNTKKQFLYLPPDQQSLSLSFFCRICSLLPELKKLEKQDFRKYFCLFTPMLKSEGQNQTTSGPTTQWTSFWWRQHGYET